MRSLVVVSPIVWVGCFTPGERAETCQQPSLGCPGGTTCPPGETCSDQTPNGLYFGGPRFGDDNSFFGNAGPHITARGGTQTITISGLDGLGFDALVDGDAFTAEKVDGDHVAITGVADGSATLRIVEPGTQLLYDRIGLGVSDVASTFISPYRWWDGPSDVLWGASDQQIVIGMSDADGARLVDDSMTITPIGGAADAVGWDVADVRAPLPDPLLVPFSTHDGTARMATAEVVSTADHVEFIPTLDAAPPTSVAVGDFQDFLFRASLGGRVIGGAGFGFAVDGPLYLEDHPIARNMAAVHGTAPGTGHLYVTLGGVQLTYAIDVHAAAKRRDAAPAPRAPELAAGDRAALAR